MGILFKTRSRILTSLCRDFPENILSLLRRFTAEILRIFL